MRILYLEDDSFDADLVRRALSRRGSAHELDVATTLAEARERLADYDSYDIVIADLHVPDGSGLELLTEVRARVLPLACVVLTSHGDETTAVAALKAGADDYQPKRPGFESQLVLTLEAALARFRRERATRDGLLRVLYAEHHLADVDLTLRHLAEHAPHIRCEVVHMASDVLARLPQDAQASCPYDVVLLDYRLPGENALDLLKAIRLERGLLLPVVIVTGQGDEEVAAQTLRLGATDYLVKHAHYLHQLPVTLESAHYQAALVRERDMLRQSEARLRESESLLIIAGQAAHLGAWMLDRDSGSVRWSDQMCLLHDMPIGSAPSMEEALAFYPPEWRERIAGAFAACMEDGTPFDEEVEIVTVRDRRLWVRAIGLAVKDASGRVVRVQGALQDISEKKHAADELRRLAKRLTDILESITDAFFTVDRDWHITYVNRETERLLGQSRDALLGRVVWEAFPQLVGTALEVGSREAMDNRHPYFFEDYSTPLGRWLEARAYPSDEGLAIYFRDLSARREAERQLREQASLLDKAQDAILVRDLSHHITYWNRSAERLYGWTADEARGRSARDLLYHGPEAFDEAMRALLATGEWIGELAQVDRHGNHLVVEGRWTLVRDDAESPHTVLAINTDISERKRLEAQFLRAQRMESLGTLAGGIAHDLNNVLAPILLSLELLRLDEQDAERQTLIDTIESSAKRGADMVAQVLSFARGMEGRRIDVAIAPLVRDLEKFANETFLKSIEVRTEVEPDLWHVTGDPTQLHQLLLNLCVNARDAMPEGGALTLAASNATLAPHAFPDEQGPVPHQCVLLEVSDTGTGIATAVLDRIFEPFFTTKELGRGTGLGLSTSLAIVKSHGGFVRVETRPGQGATFRIYLPAAAPIDHASTSASTVRHLPTGNGELVLVVDDEPHVRAMTKQILEAFGYRVLLAAGGENALALFSERPGDVSVALVDMMMPVMDGPTTIGSLRRLRHDLPIIGVSGLGPARRAPVSASLDVDLFLSKPYSADTLLSGLEQVLRVPPPTR